MCIRDRPYFEEDIKSISSETAIAARDVVGATSKLQVKRRINEARLGFKDDENG